MINITGSGEMALARLGSMVVEVTGLVNNLEVTANGVMIQVQDAPNFVVVLGFPKAGLQS